LKIESYDAAGELNTETWRYGDTRREKEVIEEVDTDYTDFHAAS
jgi:hypothetical protein